MRTQKTLNQLIAGDRFYYGQWYDFVSVDNIEGSSVALVTVTNGYNSSEFNVMMPQGAVITYSDTNNI